MTARLFTTPWPNVIRKLQSSSRLVRGQFRAEPRQRNATDILQQSPSMDAIGWQRSSGYNRRSLAETAAYRYKTIIGRRLHARTLPSQRTEAKIGCNVLNQMTNLGMPVTIRVV